MKRILLGSTALIGAAMLASPAAAQLEVTVTGSVGFQAGYADMDIGLFGSDESIDGFDFRSESEIIVRADGVADNGLQYGAKVEILTSANDPGFGGLQQLPLPIFLGGGNGDEVSLYVAGNWGKLEFGDFDGAADEMQVYAPTVGIGQVDGDYLDFTIGGIIPGLSDINETFNFLKVNDSGDGTKINYYTPEFAGFRFGVAYAPFDDINPCGVGEAVCLDAGLIDEDYIHDIVELGLVYDQQFGDFGVTVSGVYVTGDGLTLLGTDLDDWAIGAQVAYGNFTFGGHYASSFGGELDTFSLGATYELGPWGIGVSAVHGDADEIDADFTAYGVGAVYTLAPGLTVGADIVGFDAEVFGEDAIDGVTVITEIKASF